MRNRTANLLTAAGCVCLLAAGLVPAVMWPQPGPGTTYARLVALTCGGVLATVGLACWVVAALANRR